MAFCRLVVSLLVCSFASLQGAYAAKNLSNTLPDDIAWCGQAQEFEAKFSHTTEFETRVLYHTYLLDFVQSKAFMRRDGEVPVIYPQAYLVERNYRFLGAGVELLCKMKSRESLDALLPLTDVADSSCVLANQSALQLALNAAPSDVKKRYDDFGIQFEFEDTVFKTGIQWVSTPIRITKVSNSSAVYRVVSPALVTSLAVAGPRAGMHYCKLIPPRTFADWLDKLE